MLADSSPKSCKPSVFQQVFSSSQAGFAQIAQSGAVGTHVKSQVVPIKVSQSSPLLIESSPKLWAGFPCRLESRGLKPLSQFLNS